MHNTKFNMQKNANETDAINKDKRMNMITKSLRFTHLPVI